MKDFFSSKRDVHILYGIFHGRAGSWKLSDGKSFGLDEILEQWDFAKEHGTTQHLLIVSDACESGRMVGEAARMGRTDIAVQTSCDGTNPSFDTVGETFTVAVESPGARAELPAWPAHVRQKAFSALDHAAQTAVTTAGSLWIMTSQASPPEPHE